jgi:hypothetical protein
MKARIAPFANLSAVEASKMFRFVRSFSLLFLAGSLVLLTSSAEAQDVTTWHYDNNRTGWQQNETTLTPSTVLAGFGKVFQYTVLGAVFAQPLALSAATGMSGCGTCDVVFIATEEDKLYAFNAASNTQLWSTDLAANAGGTYVDCSMRMTPPCTKGVVIFPNIGVTGTPVIDRTGGILYVVSFVLLDFYPGDVQYFLHAINYKTGAEMSGSPYLIHPTASGQAPTVKCTSTTGNGTLTFDASEHFQRAGLLLLPSGNLDVVYVAFAPADSEVENGWLVSYTYNVTGGFFTTPAPTATLNVTPHGSGGGIWMDSAGLASDSTSIFVSIANGSYGAPGTDFNFGDSLLKLNASTLAAPTATTDYFTPADVFSFASNVGRCIQDEDLGSGGVLLFPDSFITGLPRLMVTADKESKLYVLNRDNLTGFNSLGDLIVQELQTPLLPNGQVELGQGYWSTPAYWEWISGSTTKRAIYYSVDATVADPQANNPPLPMNMYVLTTVVSPGPVPSIPSYSTDTAFCGHGGKPSVSSATTNSYTGVANTGIAWAIEDNNTSNPLNHNCSGIFGSAILHAYNATNLQDLYSSPIIGATGTPATFATPVVFKSRVYMGTRSEVDVFGLCGQPGYPNCAN